jgi:hypothetical protein
MPDICEEKCNICNETYYQKYEITEDRPRPCPYCKSEEINLIRKL